MIYYEEAISTGFWLPGHYHCDGPTVTTPAEAPIAPVDVQQTAGLLVFVLPLLVEPPCQTTGATSQSQTGGPVRLSTLKPPPPHNPPMQCGFFFNSTC